MYLEKFTCGPIETNSYLIGCQSTKKAAIIDAPMGVLSKIITKAEKDQLEVENLFLTHSHWDHIADAKVIKEHFSSLSIWVHSEDAKNLQDPGIDQLPLLFPIEGIKPDKLFEDKMTLLIGEMQMHVIHTPGHSPGGVCLYFPKEKILFSGDTLFQGTMGNISFPSSSPDKMWNSLAQLSTLPGDVVVFPGHGPKTEISQEKWMEKAKEIFG